MVKRITLLLVTALLFVHAAPLMAKEVYVPPALSEWTRWIMHDKDDHFCPSAYNNADERECVWPGTLEIKADDKGATFIQNWTVKAEGFVSIPGNDEIWPQSVMANDAPVAVTNQEGRPSVMLKPGDYKVSGSFIWKEVPGRIKVPDSTGLVSLSLNGEIRRSPVLDASGFLWLKEKVSEEEKKKTENRLDVKVFRMIEDKSPLEISTFIQMSISGEVRKEVLPPETLLAASNPAAISGSLPLKIDEKGEIKFEAKPGVWDIEIKSVMQKVPEEGIKTSAPFGPETWTFKPHPELRNVKIEGGIPIDPAQTTMPDEWKSFSSYMLKKDEGLHIREIKRGSASLTEGDLNLFRDFWLDFDGKGAVIRDQIKGRLDRRFFLGLEKKDYSLGRVTSEGKDQLITELGKDLGIEMEKGAIDLSAVSRMDKISSGSTFPVGWNIRFQQAEGNLHIPPGWRLLAIQGGTAPDRATWLDRWTLLDFFAVLIISIAVSRLWGAMWGVIFFLGLTVISHEPFAPKSVWIFITVTAAISAVIAKGRLKSGKAELASKIAHTAACILLAGSGIMFCYTQIRTAIYPQLEKPWMNYQSQNANFVTAKKDLKPEKPRMLAKQAPAPAPMAEMKKQGLPEAVLDKGGMEEETSSTDAVSESFTGAAPEEDFAYSLEPQEQSITQTGPGLPEWGWTTVPIKFGLAGGSRKFGLWLSPPSLNMAAGFIRVFLFLILASRFMSINLSGIFRSGPKIPQVAVISSLAVLVSLALASQARAADIPGPELLKELETRLLEPAPCFPECASLPYLRITTDTDSRGAEIIMDINAAITTAVPLPRSSETWETSAITVTGNQKPGILSKNGDTWILVNQGTSKISMHVSFKSSNTVRFSFPIKPRMVAVNAYGWNVSGIDENQQVQTELIFSRISEKTEPQGPEEEFSETASSLKGYMKISRNISLGMEWKMITRAERLFNDGGPPSLSADIPLISGEIVHNPKIKAKDGIARVELGPGETSVEWASTIPVSPEIKMQIPENADWGETWHVNASSLWHISSDGVPEVHRDGQPGTFWHPGPGETLVISANKLEAAKGESTTIDSVNVDYHAGEEFSRIVLDAKIRTSQGGVMSVKSPEGAKLKNIRINGNTIPLSETSGRLNIPLQPGSQALNIEWFEKPDEKSLVSELFLPRMIRVPEINLGRPSSNITTSIHLPDKMWLLYTHGPRLGPAVLFWGYLIIIIAGAVILGTYTPIPLRVRDWVLLGMGLAPLGPGSVIFTVMWFWAVHFRNLKQPDRIVLFRITQALFVLSALMMAGILYSAIKNGLLGIPDMQISGNGSGQELLRWTADRSGEILPRPWAAMLSVYIFRILMFAWAAWLALKVTEWARWAYSAFTRGGIWNKDK